jgi:hypothetical protein
MTNKAAIDFGLDPRSLALVTPEFLQRKDNPKTTTDYLEIKACSETLPSISK